MNCTNCSTTDTRKQNISINFCRLMNGIEHDIHKTPFIYLFVGIFYGILLILFTQQNRAINNQLNYMQKIWLSIFNLILGFIFQTA